MLHYTTRYALAVCGAALAATATLSAATIDVFAGDDIHAAVASAGTGDTVLVHDGTYLISSPLTITDFTLQSENGPATTILRRNPAGYNKMVVVTHTDAMVTGFTIREAYVDIYGSGQALEVAAGTVDNCVIRDCNSLALGGLQANMVLITGGLVTGTTIINNDSRSRVVTVSGGALEDSTIEDGYSPYDAAVLYVSSGAVRRCRLVANLGSGGTPGAAYMTGGTMENCLVWNNTTTSGSWGTVRLAGGTMMNCTVAGNTTGAGSGSGVIQSGGGTMTNCIVYGNSPAADYAGNAANVFYSCAPQLTAGVQNNITADPLFVDAGTDDYHLQGASPAIDAGTSAGAPATDLDGTARPLDGDGLAGAQHDMGAYEAAALPPPPFIVDFTATPLIGTEPLLVTFTATFGGVNPTVASYAWDFDNDGNVDDIGGPVVTTTYSGGLYTVRLDATNTTGDPGTLIESDYVKVYSSSPHVYVGSGGSDTFPYETPAKATPSMDDGMSAVNGAGYTVHVDDGDYPITAGINLNAAITVYSINGPGVTTIRRDPGVGPNFSVFNLSDPGASVTGFTIKNGWYDTISAGGAAHLTAGRIENCVMTENHRVGGSAYHNGVLWVQGTGVAADCEIVNNNPRSWGILVTGGGVMEDSLIMGNYSPYDPAPLRLESGGIVRRCEFVGNSGGHGTVYMYGTARLENCLIWENTTTSTSRGTVDLDGGTVINCTVTDNTTGAGAGSGVVRSGGTVVNSIMVGNTPSANYAGDLSAVSYSCAPELTPGLQNNIAGDPLFVNAGTDDYHLQAASPAIDAGTSTGAPSDDIEGTSRPLDGDGIGGAQHDIGAYEAPAPPVPPLVISFTATPLLGTEPLLVTFTATAGGSNPNVATYAWDFDNDGTVDDTGGPVVTNTYAGGWYSVRLDATNTTADAASHVQLNYVKVYGSALDVYVGSGGSATFPYDDWSKATTNMDDAMSAVNGAGYTVHVNDGDYPITAGINLNAAITVYSVNGPAVTTVRRDPGIGPNFPVFNLSDPGASVTGFTIKNGHYDTIGAGGAVNMTAGTVDNCIMTENHRVGGSTYHNGVLWVGGTGLVTDCEIVNNNPRSWGILVASGGAMEDCLVMGNYSPYDPAPLRLESGGTVRRCRFVGNSGGHGTIYMYGTAYLENCLVWENTTTSTSRGAVDFDGGSIVNCTIVDNTTGSGSAGSGVVQSGSGTVLNTIMWGNGPGADYTGSLPAATYSLAPQLTSGTGNLTVDPQFVDAGNDDYHLLETSPCIDAGLNQPWMLTGIDLDGNARLGSPVDLGAYEFHVVCFPCEDFAVAVQDALCGLAGNMPTNLDDLIAFVTGVVEAAAEGIPICDEAPGAGSYADCATYLVQQLMLP